MNAPMTKFAIMRAKSWDCVMIFVLVYLPVGLVWLFEGFVPFLWVAGFVTCAFIGICASWAQMFQGMGARQ